MKTALLPALALPLLALATPALAQPVLIADSGDSAWVLGAALLVALAALPGLALVQSRHDDGRAAGAMLAGSALAALVFVAIGYTLSFGEGSAVLGDAGNAFLLNLLAIREGTSVSEGVFALFELTVALFAVGLLTASVASRARPGWLLPFAGLWTLMVYVPVARWIWSGWLSDLGASDYAGGIVVSTTAGVAALVVALLLRRRDHVEAGHDARLRLAGIGLVSVGWLALLGGKVYGAGDDAAAAIVNGLVAASAALLVGMAIDHWRATGTPAVGTNALLAGLAAVSAGADAVGVPGAMLLGVVGAVAAAAASGLARRLDLGSAASAFSTVGAPAMAGAVLFPLFVPVPLGGVGFAEGNGLVTALAAQSVAVLAVALWTVVATAIAALSISMIVPMRETGGPQIIVNS